MGISLEMTSRLLAIGGRAFQPPGVITWRSTALFLGLSAAIFAAVLLIGPYPDNLYPQDTVHLLVQADYLLRGYRPHVDYCSTHGFFPFLFFIPGLVICGVSMRAVLLGQVLGAAVFGVMLYEVAARRLRLFWAFFLAISGELVLLSCTPIDGRIWREFSAAMWYNRLGFVMEAVLLMYVFVPASYRSAAGRLADCTIAGFCLMGLFFTKLSFFSPMALTFLVGTIVWPWPRRQRWDGVVAIVIAGASGIMLAWGLGASIRGYVSFLGALEMKVNPLMLAARYVQYTPTLSMFVVTTILLAWAAGEAGMLRALAREWLLCVLATGTLIVSVSTASQNPDRIPFLGLLSLVMAVALVRRARDPVREINLRSLVVVLLLVLALLVHLPKDSVFSWVFSRMNVNTLAPAEPLGPTSPKSLEGLSFPARMNPAFFSLLDRPYVEYVLAGLRLLQEARARSGQVLFVATTADGITVLTDLKYPRGGTPWWQFFIVKRPELYPLFRVDFLADTDWILRDKCDRECWSFVEYYRGDYVGKYFEKVGENKRWVLLRRRDLPQAGHTRPHREAPS